MVQNSERLGVMAKKAVWGWSGKGWAGWPHGGGVNTCQLLNSHRNWPNEFFHQKTAIPTAYDFFSNLLRDPNNSSFLPLVGVVLRIGLTYVFVFTSSFGDWLALWTKIRNL